MSHRSRARLVAKLALGSVLAAALAGNDGTAAPVPSTPGKERPSVLLVTVDTLRADRMGSYGYHRETTPNIDRLLGEGARFTQARVVEPLTNPSLSSMLTSLHPQTHGASRNGLRVRRGLHSLPKRLHDEGYRTAAFVGNWTLRDKLSGLGEHFEDYEEILTRKRWLGFLRSEATAEDLTDGAVEWLDGFLARDPGGSFLLWVHYVEPHAPYRAQDGFREPLGLPAEGKLAPSDRYDTEVAFVDHHIGRLVRKVRRRLPTPPLIVFASDHGESLGEHDYWGHGRNLYEPGLWIPMGLHWEGRLSPGVVDAPALNLDLAPTVLSLLGMRSPEAFAGYDWSRVLNGAPAPVDRVTHYQAHRGAVISKHESDLARRKGLISVALIDRDIKGIFQIESRRVERINLEDDPLESRDLAESESAPSDDLLSWMADVNQGLTFMDYDAPKPIDDESAEQLRALGYVD